MEQITHKKRLTQSWIFWLFFALSSLIAAQLTIYLFPRAFPIIHLDITMDREQATEHAQQLAQKYSFKPELPKASAQFSTDTATKMFVELEAGGKDAFVAMMQENIYEPYTWRVRLFKPYDPREVTVIFTPEGKPYGFGQTLSETDPGPDLPQEEARTIAEQTARQEWGVNFEPFVLVDASKEVQPGGRADHVFVYERTDKKIGEGFYRLRLEVSGNTLTELHRFVKIPEGFIRRYQEMRAGNETISTIGWVFLLCLYFIGGCILGTFYLVRNNWISWRGALFWGLFIALLTVGESINNLPLSWLCYKTSLSPWIFLAQYLSNMLYQSLFGTHGIFVLTLTFVAAEGLGRRAFGNHIQFWKLWDPQIATSWAVLGRTVAGYLLSVQPLLYVAFFYLATSTWFGWWSPSSTLFNPNDLATYLPWYNPVVRSLGAGFWEECLFRAIPLAGAVLIGRYFKRETLCLAGGMILQALVFGAVHANYASMPSYARLVELIAPSLLWGGIYLLFGLLPTIIAHFVYDTILFSLPVFVASSNGIWISKLLIILCTLIPLFVTAYYRLRYGQWHTISEQAYNRAWQPAARTLAVFAQLPAHVIPSSRSKLIGLLMGTAVLCVLLTAPFIRQSQNAIPLQLSRTQAIHTARAHLEAQNVELGDPWYPLTAPLVKVTGNSRVQHTFIWQQGGKDLYESLVNKYLRSPYWLVRFARFTGQDVVERKREFRAYVNDAGVFRTENIVPELEAGPQLSEVDARTIAHRALQEIGLNPAQLKEVSAKSDKQPNRLDWNLTFQDPQYDLGAGQARITVEITGDTVTDVSHFVHVPEEYTRSMQQYNALTSIVTSFINLGLIALLLLGLFVALQSYGLYSVPSYRLMALLSGCFALLLLIKLACSWPVQASNFVTSKPFGDQFLNAYAITAIWALLRATVIAVLVVVASRTRTLSINQSHLVTALSGLLIGVLAVALQFLAHKYVPAIAPIWANYESLKYSFPFVVSCIDALFSFYTLTATCLLGVITMNRFTGFGTRNHLGAVALMVLFGYMLVGVAGLNHLLFFVVFGALISILIAVAYFTAIRFDKTVAIYAVATYLIADYLQQMIYNALPLSIPMYAASIIITAFLAWYTTIRIRGRFFADQNQA